MKVRNQHFFVGALFILVFVVFSLADRDTKKNDPNYPSLEQKVQVLTTSNIAAPDSAKANH
jgi:hypothetical protein